MEHRGIEYQIKIGITKHEWAWSIRTSPPKQGKVSGSRDDAVYAAVRAIEQWCYQHPDDCEQSWSRKSEQSDKWSFCLTAGTLCPANQERP